MPLDSLHVSTMPFLVGEVKFMSGTQTPAGFVKANGQLLSRTQYPLLWAYAQSSGILALNDAIRTDGQYTVGDGSTTFRVPDYRGEFLRCLDEGKGKDTSPNRVAGSDQLDAFQGHEHEFYDLRNGGGGGYPGAGSVDWTRNTQGIANKSGFGTARVSTETRPRNIGLPVFIFAGA